MENQDSINEQNEQQENIENENENQDEEIQQQKSDENSDNLGLNTDQQDNADNSDKFGSPENYDYSQIELPDGMQLDKELTDEFNPIAKELNLSNSSANKLVGLAVKLAQKNATTAKDAIRELQTAEVNSYKELLNKDEELNVLDTAQYDKYLSVANEGIKAVATKELRNFIKEKGLTHHPEFIKLFHKIGEMCSESSLPDINIPPAPKERLADMMYGKKNDKDD